MNQDGVFSTVIYQAQGVSLKDVDRIGCLIGPNFKMVGNLQASDSSGATVNISSGSPEYRKFKPLVDGKELTLVAAGDLFINLYNGANGYIEQACVEGITANSGKYTSPAKPAVGMTLHKPCINLSNYNTASGTIVSLDDLFFKIVKEVISIPIDGLSGITVTTGAQNSTVRFNGNYYQERYYKNIKVGDTLVLPVATNGAYEGTGSSEILAYLVKSVDDATSTVTIIGTTGTSCTLAGTATLFVCKSMNEDASGTATNAIMKVFSRVKNDSINQGVTISGIGDLVDIFGSDAITDPNFPLAYASFLYLMGGGTKFRIYGTAGTDATNFGYALDAARNDDVYYMIPVSNDTDILSNFNNHVKKYSATEYKKERIVIACRNMYRGATCDNFITNKGYQSSDTIGADYLKCYTSGYTAGAEVARDYAKNLAIAYNSERFVMISPGHAKMSLNGAEVLLTGYELAAYIAGVISDKPTGYGLSKEKLPGLTGLASVNFFDAGHLNTMRQNGVFLLAQDNKSTPVYIYHQNTTSQDILEKKELSLIMAIDQLQKEVRACLDNFIANGMENRISVVAQDAETNKAYFVKLNNAAKGIKYKFVTEKKIVADFKIIAIAPSEIYRDRVDYKIAVTLLYPVNGIDVFIYVF